jgi:rhodanese-related sulfurtransferase
MRSNSSRRKHSRSESETPHRPGPARSVKLDTRSVRSLPRVLLGGGLLVAVLAVVAGVAVLSSRPSATPIPASPHQTPVIEANAGPLTNITPDLLVSMMKTKDVTLLNVKTPYVGEISGTDLYIPYTELAARAAELPSDKGAPLVVYCQSGHESAIAAQTLLDLGYTNIQNLEGGMAAWVASGRGLVRLNRS